mgnify:CR=1 FL=1
MNDIALLIRSLQTKGLTGPILIMLILGMMILPLPAFRSEEHTSELQSH